MLENTTKCTNNTIQQHTRFNRQYNYYCKYVQNLFMCAIFLLTITATVQTTYYEGDDCVMNGIPGICTLGSKCGILKEAWHRGIVTIRDIVTCGFGIYEQIVCCPARLHGFQFTPNNVPQRHRPHTHTTQTPHRARVHERPAVKACHRIDNGLMPNLTPHILDGVPVELGEYPHMVAIGYNQIGGDGSVHQFDCGGSLIERRFVLTAAHCVNDPRKRAAVVLMGITNFRDREQMRNAIQMRIRRYYIHPEYSSGRTYNDVAVVELVADVQYSERVYPACLYTDTRDPSSHAALYVSGWGTTNIRTLKHSDTLLKVKLAISPLEYCNASYAQYGFTRHLRNGIQPTQLCAHNYGITSADSCYGDSGGPLIMVADGARLKYRLVGIVSAGFSCGSSIPSLYTRVAAYLDYIESIVWPRIH